MLKRFGVILAWVTATVATATITLAAVGSAGGQVSDRPGVPVASADLAARFAASTTIVAASSTATSDTSQPLVTTTYGADPTGTAIGREDSTTLASTTTQASGTSGVATPTTDGSITTATTTGSATTTTSGVTTTMATTSTTAGSQNLTFEQPGVGRVTISVSGSGVTYVSSVVLGSGYRAEVSDHGPEKVEVKFESESGGFVFTAQVSGGVLQAGFSAHSDD